MGSMNLSEVVFSWIQNRTNEDGSYWCGFTCPDMTIWPKDKSTWTNAAVLIAADAIYDLTPASRLFSHLFWKTYGFSSYWMLIDTHCLRSCFFLKGDILISLTIFSQCPNIWDWFHGFYLSISKPTNPKYGARCWGNINIAWKKITWP